MPKVDNSRTPAQRRRDWINAMSPSELAEYKQNKIYDKERRDDLKREKAANKQRNIYVKREIALLKYMLKNDVRYYHHGSSDSKQTHIQAQIDSIKRDDNHREYNPYIWNYQGEGNSYMPKSHLGCIWRSSEFETIYDVPLDGSYKFNIYDSGQRGLGSFNGITATKVEQPIHVPNVNPGSIIPLTAF